jgi:dTDP-4-amino-4,6-dideoxygalactose transaminase
MIRLTRPFVGDEERAAAAAVLASGMLVQGECVAAFEASVAGHVGRRHAIAVSSGTAALELALRAIGVGPGDRVLCPDLTWPSPAHAILALGAEPVLVDVAPDEWNAGPDEFASALDVRPKAAITIDQFGNPARARAIAAALPGVALVVDAACSLGSHIDGIACGAFGAIACTSFHPRKVITTGEGGMCLTDDDTVAARLRVLRNHGQSAPGVFERPAGNLRMSEIAAAIGAVQMARLPALVAARRTLGAEYDRALGALGLATQKSAPGAESNRQTLGVLLPPGRTEADRDRVVAALAAQGVEAGRLSHALHRLPHLAICAAAARALGRSLHHSASISARGFALPLHPALAGDEQARVVTALRDVLT